MTKNTASEQNRKWEKCKNKRQSLKYNFQSQQFKIQK